MMTACPLSVVENNPYKMMRKNGFLGQCACFSLCLSFVWSFFAQAGDQSVVVPNDNGVKQSAGEESEEDARQKIINLNFSPEDRIRLRKALDAYARAVDPEHEKVEERRRAMQESLEDRFLASDGDNDGSIDRQEATQSLPQVARNFSLIDTNQDEVITLDELEMAQTKMLERRKSDEAALAAKEALEKEAALAKKRKKSNKNSSKRAVK